MKITKATFKKRLRRFSAHWISNIQEEVIVTSFGKDDHLEYGVKKGWIWRTYDGIKYWTYYFTEKGEDEILRDLKDNTCISGKVVK